VEQTIRIVYPTEDAAEEAGRFYRGDGFEVGAILPAADGAGWVVEAFRPDVEGDGLWAAGRLTAFRSV
jgi:hypothetical protein